MSTAVESAFPTSHQSDTEYSKHCVSCGLLLQNWSKEYDGHGCITRGDLIHQQPYDEIFEGRYCLSCAGNVKEILMSLLKKRPSVRAQMWKP